MVWAASNLPDGDVEAAEARNGVHLAFQLEIIVLQLSLGAETKLAIQIGSPRKDLSVKLNLRVGSLGMFKAGLALRTHFKVFAFVAERGLRFGLFVQMSGLSLPANLNWGCLSRLAHE